MHGHADPQNMSPDERLAEVATILAAGYLRLKQRTRYLPNGGVTPHVLAEESSEFQPESSGGSGPASPSCPPG